MKLKKCNGNGKAKDYGCGKDVVQNTRVYGLGRECGCYSNWLLNSTEGKAKIERSKLKATKPRRDFQRYKDELESEKKLSWLLINVRTVVHEYIRTRDKGKPCVSCGTEWNETFQAGHWKKAELYPELRYNEFNILGQCKRCNLFLDGNVQKYSDNILERISVANRDEIERIASNSKKNNFKWDRQELIQIREKFKKKLKEL